MQDAAHKWTDRRIESISRRIAREYGSATRNMRSILKERMSDYAKELAEAKQMLKDGKIAESAYKRELQAIAVAKARDRELLYELNGIASNSREAALAIVASETPIVYAENANFAMFTVEKAARIDTMFSLVDAGAVRSMMKRNPKLLPLIPDANVASDTIWHTRKFTSAITQSILLGESITDSAKRISGVLGMDRAAAIRTARTALTAAQNLGRMDSYERAEALGIRGSKVWVATIDGHTRDSHVMVDGEKVGLDETFSNGLLEPGDTNGEPSEVYNCRCTIRYEVDGIEQEAHERFSRLPSGIGYDEWKELHK